MASLVIITIIMLARFTTVSYSLINILQILLMTINKNNKSIPRNITNKFNDVYILYLTTINPCAGEEGRVG